MTSHAHDTHNQQVSQRCQQHFTFIRVRAETDKSYRWPYELTFITSDTLNHTDRCALPNYCISHGKSFVLSSHVAEKTLHALVERRSASDLRWPGSCCSEASYALVLAYWRIFADHAVGPSHSVKAAMFREINSSAGLRKLRWACPLLGCHPFVFLSAVIIECSVSR